jgi:hypothetical protein
MALVTGASSMQAALDGAGNQVWGQFTPSVEGAPETGDAFGTVVATGDFNGDGRDDLAVGIPNESVATITNAGAVNVIYGGGNGLRVAGDQIWTRDPPDVPGNLEAYGHFGAALAAGDFNDDGFDDLAIGNPGSGPEAAAVGASYGAVNVLYGSPSGLRSSLAQLWTQDSFDVIGVAEPGDRFGNSLAAGDFNQDGFDDLAIGVPYEIIGGNGFDQICRPAEEICDAGAVNVLYGSANRLTENGNQIWTQDSQDVEGVAEDGDVFGISLTSGDFDGDGFFDLAIGAQGEDIEANGALTAGAVNVLYGAASGLTAAGNQIWYQGSNGVKGASENSDIFGHALATGDLNGDGYDDLAVGVPHDHEALDHPNTAGAVNILYGSASGLTASGDQLWHQGSNGVSGDLETPDKFGWALSIGDFNDDGYDDLAIGAHHDSTNGIVEAGAVNVLYGSANGLTAVGDQLWTQRSSGVAGVSEMEDRFGASLAAGDFDGDGHDDLAVGVPGEDDEANGVIDAGAVNVLYGSSSLPI